jgi:predicted kinase
MRAGRDFVWNATNLKRDLRNQLIDFFAGYGARVRVVYVETDAATLEARNRHRATPLPQAAIQRMLDSWTVPDSSQAHRIEIRAATSDAGRAYPAAENSKRRRDHEPGRTGPPGGLHRIRDH